MKHGDKFSPEIVHVAPSTTSWTNKQILTKSDGLVCGLSLEAFKTRAYATLANLPRLICLQTRVIQDKTQPPFPFEKSPLYLTNKINELN